MVDHTETALIAQREARQDRFRKAPRKQAEARAHERSKTPYWRKRFVQWALPWRGDTDDEDSEDDSSVPQTQEYMHREIGDQDVQEEEPDLLLYVTSGQDLVADQIQDVQAVVTDGVGEMGDDTQPRSPSPSPSTHFESLEPSSSSAADETEDRHQIVEPRGSKRKAGSRSSTPVLSTRRTTRSQAAKVEGSPAPDEPSTEEPRDPATDVVEITGDLAQEAEESTSKAGRKKKKKKNNKKRTKGVTYDEAEELEKELVNEQVSLAEKIQTSKELIEASDLMLQRLDQEPANDPFSEQGDPVQEQDDETFHSTSQFGFTESGDENQDSLQSADITIDYDEVKYYPPDESKSTEDGSVDEIMDMGDIADEVKEGVAVKEVEEVEGTEEVEDKEDVEEVNILEDVEEVEEVEGVEEAPELEIEHVIDGPENQEPLMRNKDTSAEMPGHHDVELIEEDLDLNNIQSTPETPVKEHFEDCPPIVTPAAQKVKDIFVSESDELPESSTAFLALFFAKQAGKMLTPMQADYCKRLIDDAVISSNKTESGSTTWHAGEDGVSFKGQPQNRQSPLSTLSTIPRDQLAMDSTAPPVIDLETVRKAPSTTSVLRAVKPIAPFKVIRQGVSDLYHEASASEPKQRIMPPLADYLEINKYEGVAWDDLPGHVKVKRFLEWKGPEAPEVVRRRAMDERKKIREAFEEANKIVPDSLKRGADNVDAELPSKKAIIEMVAVDSPVAAPISSAPELTPSTESVPKLSAIAQEVLSIVNNDKAEKKLTMPAAASSSISVPTSNFKSSSASFSETSPTAPFSIAAVTYSVLDTGSHNPTSLSELESGKPGIFAIPAPTLAAPSIFSVPINPSSTTKATYALAANPSVRGTLSSVPVSLGTFAPPKADSSKISESPVITTMPSSFSSAMPKTSTFVEPPKASGNPFSFGTPASASTTVASKPTFSFGGSNPFASTSSPVAPTTSVSTFTPSASAQVSSGFAFGGSLVSKTGLKPMPESGVSTPTAASLATTAAVTTFRTTFSEFGQSSSTFPTESPFSSKSSDGHNPSVIEIDDDDSTDDRSVGESGEGSTSNSQSTTQAGDVTVAFDEGDEDDDESFNLDDDEDEDDGEGSFNEEHSREINLEEYSDGSENVSQADQSFERADSDLDDNASFGSKGFATASIKSSFGQSRFNFEFDTSMTDDNSEDEDQSAHSQFGDEEDEEAMEQDWEEEVSGDEDGSTISPLASPVMTRRTL